MGKYIVLYLFLKIAQKLDWEYYQITVPMKNERLLSNDKSNAQQCYFTGNEAKTILSCIH